MFCIVSTAPYIIISSVQRRNEFNGICNQRRSRLAYAELGFRQTMNGLIELLVRNREDFQE